ncbi:MAG TPA: hypothetical protein VJX67_06520 [Blastocatellia bacterium]|nr:hypothetical protein [Blastocatellia bacterium]
MIIIGIHFFAWGSGETDRMLHCGRCGAVQNFIVKKGMRFITIFFIIPILPISGIKHMVQCPSCGARYQSAAQSVA